MGSSASEGAPKCRFCGYSLAGLTRLICPECGQTHVPPEPVPPPPRFLELAARPYVVCPLNAGIIILAAVGGPALSHRDSLDWYSGCLCAAFGNLILLGVLTVWCRRSTTVALVLSSVAVVLSLLVSIMLGIGGRLGY
jgi:hypothetical protein